MLSGKEEEARKYKIHGLWINVVEGPKEYNLAFCYAHMSINYKLLKNFKDLQPNYFFTSFLLMIDGHKELFPLTEKLHDMFVKIMKYIKIDPLLLTGVANLDLYKICIDVGYNQVTYYKDLRMITRLGVLNREYCTFNVCRSAPYLIKYVQRYLTTV